MEAIHFGISMADSRWRGVAAEISAEPRVMSSLRWSPQIGQSLLRTIVSGIQGFFLIVESACISLKASGLHILCPGEE